jgi:hypothetical protein
MGFEDLTHGRGGMFEKKGGKRRRIHRDEGDEGGDLKYELSRMRNREEAIRLKTEGFQGEEGQSMNYEG